MSYPKVWLPPSGSLGSAVGESGVRQLQSGAPFTTKSGPDSISRHKGGFDEVILTGGSDGWYSTSDTSIDPTRYVGSTTGRGVFGKRGTLISGAVYHDSGNIFAMGRGWAVTPQRVATDSWGPGWLAVDILKTTNGGMTARSLFHVHFSASVWDGVGYNGSFHFAFVGDKYYVYAATENLIPYGGSYVARPCVTYGSYNPVTQETAEDSWLLPTVPIEEQSYSMCQVTFLLPTAPLIHYASYTDLPAFYYWAGWWVQVDNTNALYPGVDPLDTRPLDRPALISWKTVVLPLTVHTVLIETVYSYRESYTHAPWIPRAVQSIMDIYTGVISYQRIYDGTTYGAIYAALGPAAWVHKIGSEFHVTTDGGATFQLTGVPSDASNFRPIGHYDSTRGPGKNPFCEVIFTITLGGDRVLMTTSDNFETVTQRATIARAADIHSDYDFNQVAWVGSADSPAPIDAHYPWAHDTRVAPPDWYMT